MDEETTKNEKVIFCRMCGRRLKDVKSKELELGPKCLIKYKEKMFVASDLLNNSEGD